MPSFYRLIFLGAASYAAALFQTQLFYFFPVFGMTFPLVPVFALFLFFRERPPASDALAAALFGGFFLDVFSEHPIGFHMILFAGFVLVFNLLLQKYVRFSS